MVHDTFLLYVNPKDGSVKSVLLFDSDTTVRSGFRETGSRTGLIVTNMTRSLYAR